MELDVDIHVIETAKQECVSSCQHWRGKHIYTSLPRVLSLMLANKLYSKHQQPEL